MYFTINVSAHAKYILSTRSVYVCVHVF